MAYFNKQIVQNEVMALQALLAVDVKRQVRPAVYAGLALTLGLAASGKCYADAVNTVNTVTDVAGGTYYNTAGNQTTFNAANNAGLVIGAGTVVRGVEVNTSMTPTGNGGNMVFNAPGSMVRVDGTIDVSALKSGGAFVGNGGSVTVNSAYLYQNGTIVANGINGGNVVVNVNSMTATPNSSIEAKGFGGAGGKVEINANGIVDVQQQAIIDTSGKVIGSVDSNVIRIEGAMVNVDGMLIANGVQTEGAGTQGGTIRIVAVPNSPNRDVDVAAAKEAIQNAKTDCFFCDQKVEEASNRLTALADCNDGAILVNGKIQANGGHGSYGSVGGDGGNITLLSLDTQNGLVAIDNGKVEANGGDGCLTADGGKGGTVRVESPKWVKINGQVTAEGGNGGDAVCESCAGDGGDGGTVEVLGTKNILGFGYLSTRGGDGGNGIAYGGKSGNGGNGGTIVVENGNNNLSYNIWGGQGGNDGYYSVGKTGAPGDIVQLSNQPNDGTSPCDACDEPPPPPPPPVEEPPAPPPTGFVPFILNPQPQPLALAQASNCLLAYEEGTFPSDVNALAYTDSALCNMVALEPPTTVVASTPQGTVLLAQEKAYPETVLRRRLEAEIAQPTVRRAVKVRGYW